MPDRCPHEPSSDSGRSMSGATWWVALAAAVIGAAAGIAGSVWASRTQRRTAGRAEWFRRLQWAWEQTAPSPAQRATAGLTVMDYIADTRDPRDAAMILAITPITREIGRLMVEFPTRPRDVDIAADHGDTGLDTTREDGDHNGEKAEAR